MQQLACSPWATLNFASITATRSLIAAVDRKDGARRRKPGSRPWKRRGAMTLPGGLDMMLTPPSWIVALHPAARERELGALRISTASRHGAGPPHRSLWRCVWSHAPERVAHPQRRVRARDGRVKDAVERLDGGLAARQRPREAVIGQIPAAPTARCRAGGDGHFQTGLAVLRMERYGLPAPAQRLRQVGHSWR